MKHITSISNEYHDCLFIVYAFIRSLITVRHNSLGSALSILTGGEGGAGAGGGGGT